MKDCKENQIRNPETGRCVLKTSPLGKKIMEGSPKRIRSRRVSPIRASPKKQKPCNSDQIRNPKTGRCVLKTSPLGKKIMKGSLKSATPRRVSPRRASPKKQKPCNSDQIRNPKTGRCVLKRSPIGKKIMEDIKFGSRRIASFPLKSTPRKSSPRRFSVKSSPRRFSVKPIQRLISSKKKDSAVDSKDIFTILRKKFTDKTIFDESYINRIFGLFYLTYKYKNQCILLKPVNTYFDSKKLQSFDYVYLKYYGKNNDFKYIPDIFWETIKNCIINKKRFIIIRLSLYYGPSIAHANLLIYDTLNKTLERFDSNGLIVYDKKLYDTVDTKIEKLFIDNLGKDALIKYYKPIDYCPILIFQNLEDQRLFKEGDPAGFCAVWCLWYADLRLANPDFTREELINLAIDKIKKEEGGDFKKFIRNYSNFIATLRKELKKAANPEEELEKMFSSNSI